MATDDERREVAERLRELEAAAIPDARIADHAITAEVIAAGVMYDLPEVKGLFNRLADLIEPSESGQNRDRNQDSVQKESPIVQIEHECDRNALLALADEIEYGASPDDGEYHDLPAIMVAAVARKQMEYADRIREACGVVDAG